MPEFLREHSWPVVFSVALHGLLVLAMVLTAVLNVHHVEPSLEPLPIDAVVIDSQMLRAAQKVNSDRVEAAAAQERAQEEEKVAAAARAKEEEQAADRANAVAAAKEDAARDAKAADEAEAAAAATARAAAAQQHNAVDAKKNAAAFRAAQVQRRLDIEKAMADADAKRDADAEQAAKDKKGAELKAAADARKAADDTARRERESELKNQLADEEHRSAVEASPLRDRYIASLRNKIQSVWIKPGSASVGIDCLVAVTQIPGGEVTGAHVTQCNGDAAVRQSIENAVYRASPLPDPPDKALFERNFVFRFKPQ